jgi:hypothetical protein
MCSKCPDSSIGILTSLKTGHLRNQGWFLRTATGLFHTMSKNSSGLHPASCQINIKIISFEVSGRSLKLTIHLHLVARLTIRGIMSHDSPYVFSLFFKRGRYFITFIYLFTSFTRENNSHEETIKYPINIYLRIWYFRAIFDIQCLMLSICHFLYTL